MRNIRQRCRYIISGVLVIAAAGCAGPRLSLKQQNEIYPAKMDPAAPLVLAVPGLNIPGEPIRQENHFGNLVEMLAQKGIVAKILAYDTADYPLTPVADLGFDRTSIATTRVTPFLEDEVEKENARRAKLGLPPLKELVIFSFSQGSVIASRIVSRINCFKKEFADFSQRFGQEWAALLKDPEFRSLMDAVGDYMTVHDIRVQREKDFEQDRDFQMLYARLRKKLDAQADAFREYIISPEKRFPDVDHFEPVTSPKYPKRYPAFAAYVRELGEQGRMDDLKEFFIDYVNFDSLLDVKIRFISTAGSFFGSPRADAGYALAEAFLPAKMFIGRELNQIKDTRLGSVHQLQGVRYLYDFLESGWYPYEYRDTLFILGINGDRGDGIVEQSSAHLADHICVVVTPGKAGKPSVKVQRLPDFVIVPLHVTHLPKPKFPIGETYGASYMVPGNPSFDCLLDFIRNDWEDLARKGCGSDQELRQCMVQAVGVKRKGEPLKLNFRRIGTSPGLTVTGQFVNPDSGAIVWTGKFTGKRDYMNLCGKETVSGSMTFEYWQDPGKKNTIEVPVSPGCNTFVGIQAD